MTNDCGASITIISDAVAAAAAAFAEEEGDDADEEVVGDVAHGVFDDIGAYDDDDDSDGDNAVISTKSKSE